jgi:hypothetical protein
LVKFCNGVILNRVFRQRNKCRRVTNEHYSFVNLQSNNAARNVLSKYRRDQRKIGIESPVVSASALQKSRIDFGGGERAFILIRRFVMENGRVLRLRRRYLYEQLISQHNSSTQQAKAENRWNEFVEFYSRFQGIHN